MLLVIVNVLFVVGYMFAHRNDSANAARRLEASKRVRMVSSTCKPRPYAGPALVLAALAVSHLTTKGAIPKDIGNSADMDVDIDIRCSRDVTVFGMEPTPKTGKLRNICR